MTICAYKGFTMDWKCREFQYEIDRTYEHTGTVEICESGFHACEYPLDCFGYYPPSDSRYAMVETPDDVQRHDDDTKIVSASITIKAEISIPELVTRSVAWILSRINSTAAEHSNQSAATNTGDWSAATNTGYQSAATVTGNASVVIATGRESKARAAAGSAIVLVNRDEDGAIRHIRASKVGENGIKPDVFYILNDDGEFVEAA